LPALEREASDVSFLIGVCREKPGARHCRLDRVVLIPDSIAAGSVFRVGGRAVIGGVHAFADSGRTVAHGTALAGLDTGIVAVLFPEAAAFCDFQYHSIVDGFRRLVSVFYAVIVGVFLVRLASGLRRSRRLVNKAIPLT
jgi:hypothetical protein